MLEQFWLKNEWKKLVGWPSKVGCVFVYLFIYLDNTHEMMMGSLMITRSMVIYHDTEKKHMKNYVQLSSGKRIQGKLYAEIENKNDLKLNTDCRRHK